MSALQPKVFEIRLRLSEDQALLLAQLFEDAGLEVAFGGTAQGKDCDGDFNQEWDDLETQLFYWSEDKQ